jgi:hypothetical protein
MANLASAYAGAGRHREALALDERSLQFMRHTLPENHPDLGGWQGYHAVAVHF